MQPYHRQDEHPKHSRPYFAGAFLLGSLFLVALVVVVPVSYFLMIYPQSARGEKNTATLSVPTPNPTSVPEGTTILPQPGVTLTGVSLPSIGNNLSPLTAFEQKTGKGASMVLFYQAWGAADGQADFPATWMSMVRQHGSLPYITWEPWEPISYPESMTQPKYSLKNIIDGDFDDYTIKWAKAAKSWHSPFFLRFAPEMNGNWTPWSEGVNGNQAGEFKQAWIHIHDIFTVQGVKNVTWVWCPNVVTMDSLPLPELYPGDDYVDWTAMDGFNWGGGDGIHTWQTFTDIFSETYNELLQLTSRPIMIAETGSAEQSGNKANWISSAYTVELPQNFPNIKAIVWFNQATQKDWRIESSTASLSAFSRAIQASDYGSNTFANYNGG